MIKKLGLFGLLVWLVMMGVAAVGAQSDENCTVSDVLREQIRTAETVEALISARDALNRQIAICGGLDFSGGTGDAPAKESLSTAPFTLEAGQYWVMYELDMISYGEFDLVFENLNTTEYIEALYEYQRNVIYLEDGFLITVEGGRYTAQIEASNTPHWSFYMVKVN